MTTNVTITAGEGRGQVAIFSKGRSTEIEIQPGPFRPEEDEGE
jgi:hypothetical protein